MIVVTLIGIYLALLFILNYMFRLSVSSSDSANAHLPGCFRPWIFHLNIGLNMLPSDSFVSCLDYLLGYSTGAGLICNWLSLRCLVPWINHLPPVYWSTFWKSSLKWRWVVSLTHWRTTSSSFLIRFTYILMPHNMIKPFFIFFYWNLIFISLTVFYFCIVFSFYIYVVLTLSIRSLSWEDTFKLRTIAF